MRREANRFRAKNRQKNQAKSNDKGNKTQKSLGTAIVCCRQNPKSVTALTNLQKYCEEHLKGQYVIEVIDLLEKATTGRRRPDICYTNTGTQSTRADT
jgi:uncharacterized protein YeeX (DUF496 family)